MKKLILYTIIMVLLTGCIDLLNSSSKKNLSSLTFDKTIDLFDPTEIIFDPYNLILIYDPIYMLVEYNSSWVSYAVKNCEDGIFLPDKSLVLEILEGHPNYCTAYDFKEFTISFRKYYKNYYNDFSEVSLSEYHNINAIPISREDPYEVLELYDMKTNTYEDYVNGCSFDYEKETYFPETELCQTEYHYENDDRGWMLLERFCCAGDYHDSYYSIFSRAIYNSDDINGNLINQYYKEIIKYIEKNYDFN